MSPREGTCPEPVSLPFLQHPQGPISKEWGSLLAGYPPSLPKTVSTLRLSSSQSFPPLKMHLLHAATQDLTWKALSLLLSSTLYIVWGVGREEHRMESGWEPGSSLGLPPAPSCPRNPGLTEREAGLWTQLLPPHGDVLKARLLWSSQYARKTTGKSTLPLVQTFLD